MSPGTLLLGWPKTWLLRHVAEFSIICKALSNDDDHGEEEVLVTFNVSFLKVIFCVVSEAAFGSVSVSGAPQRTSKPTCTVSGASARLCWGDVHG